MSRYAIALVTALLFGCTGNGSANSFCLVAEPILICETDQICDATAEQILEHNLIYERLCKN